MKELLEKYPKAAKVVKEYYLNKLLKSLEDKGLDEDFKEHVRQQGVPEEQIFKLLEANPIALTDIFDSHGILINIDAFFNSKKEKTFGYLIDDGKDHPMEDNRSVVLPDRKTAEQGAVEYSFKLLEEKL